MQPSERYAQLYEHTDPVDPIVAADIARGARWGYGLTDMHHHLPRLRELAKGCVLEIGVRFGSSTAALLAGVEENGGRVFSVDIDPCGFARGLFEGHPQWTFVQTDSKSRPFVHSVVNLFWSDCILDLLFIDGDHTYEGVTADLTNFGFLAEKIALHDYHRLNNGQVVRAVAEYMKMPNCRHKRLRVYRESNGLAVLS